MFEKEAEEYTDTAKCVWTSETYWVDCRDEVEQAFQDGAEFGYNKANEWHSLRKHPDDLPQEGEIVLCYCLGVYGVSYPITAQMYADSYDTSVHHWWSSVSNGNRPLEELRNVVAWKEIVLPMEVMDEKETDKI